jgi:hypothetical protein
MGKTNTGQAATNKLASHWLQETKAVHRINVRTLSVGGYGLA